MVHPIHSKVRTTLIMEPRENIIMKETMVVAWISACQVNSIIKITITRVAEEEAIAMGIVVVVVTWVASILITITVVGVSWAAEVIKDMIMEMVQEIRTTSITGARTEATTSNNKSVIIVVSKATSPVTALNHQTKTLATTETSEVSMLVLVKVTIRAARDLKVVTPEAVMLTEEEAAITFSMDKMFETNSILTIVKLISTNEGMKVCLLNWIDLDCLKSRSQLKEPNDI